MEIGEMNLDNTAPKAVFHYLSAATTNAAKEDMDSYR